METKDTQAKVSESPLHKVKDKETSAVIDCLLAELKTEDKKVSTSASLMTQTKVNGMCKGRCFTFENGVWIKSKDSICTCELEGCEGTDCENQEPEYIIGDRCGFCEECYKIFGTWATSCDFGPSVQCARCKNHRHYFANMCLCGHNICLFCLEERTENKEIAPVLLKTLACPICIPDMALKNIHEFKETLRELEVQRCFDSKEIRLIAELFDPTSFDLAVKFTVGDKGVPVCGHPLFMRRRARFFTGDFKTHLMPEVSMDEKNRVAFIYVWGYINHLFSEEVFETCDTYFGKSLAAYIPLFKCMQYFQTIVEIPLAPVESGLNTLNYPTQLTDLVNDLVIAKLKTDLDEKDIAELKEIYPYLRLDDRFILLRLKLDKLVGVKTPYDIIEAYSQYVSDSTLLELVADRLIEMKGNFDEKDIPLCRLFNSIKHRVEHASQASPNRYKKDSATSLEAGLLLCEKLMSENPGFAANCRIYISHLDNTPALDFGSHIPEEDDE